MQEFHGHISIPAGLAGDGIKIKSGQTNDKMARIELIVPNGKQT
jgi:hypothetical protein